MDEIDELKKEKDASILAHFYVDGEIQDIADYTGDSLKLARDATKVDTGTIVFAGVALHGGICPNHESGKASAGAGLAGRVFVGRQLPGRSIGHFSGTAESPGTRIRYSRLHQHNSSREESL